MAKSNLPESEKKSTMFRAAVTGGEPGEYLDQRNAPPEKTIAWLISTPMSKTLVLVPCNNARDRLAIEVYIRERAGKHSDVRALCEADSVVRFSAEDAMKISKDPIAALPALEPKK